VSTPAARLRGRVDAVDGGRHLSRLDLVLLCAAVALVILAHVVGRALEASGAILVLPFPPIFAEWGPHVSLWTLPALALVVAGVRLQRVAGTLRWGALLGWGWLLGFAWIFSLASVDGDWATKLLSPHEYLHDLPAVGDPLTFLHGFTGRIVGVPDAWTTHVSVHPPLATLFFWFLQQAGLGGPAWGALACMLVGSLAGPAWAVTLRALGAPSAARQLVPWAALFPGAVWIGVSGDAVFLGVASVALMAATWGAVHRSAIAALAGGVLLGATVYLSYGHVVFGVVVVAALLLSVRASGWTAVRSGWLLAALGASAVAAFFTLAGFRWWEALGQVQLRYYEGIASVRPYGYFIWANLAAFVVCASPVVVLVIATAVRTVAGAGRRTLEAAPAWLALAGLVAIVLSDLSGLSKAETERIWLTFAFAVWCGAALAPPSWRRWGLVAAAAWALAVNHLLLTEW
jgi:methylthioxylose transferase